MCHWMTSKNNMVSRVIVTRALLSIWKPLEAILLSLTWFTNYCASSQQRRIKVYPSIRADFMEILTTSDMHWGIGDFYDSFILIPSQGRRKQQRIANKEVTLCLSAVRSHLARLHTRNSSGNWAGVRGYALQKTAESVVTYRTTHFQSYLNPVKETCLHAYLLSLNRQGVKMSITGHMVSIGTL